MRSDSLLSCFQGRRRFRRPALPGTRRHKALAVGVAIALLSAASGASLVAVAARDDLALAAVEEREAVSRAYEEKIRALQVQLDQAASRRSADRNSVEARLSALLARQAAFETRQVLVQDLAEQVGLGHAAAAPAGPASTVEVTSPASAHSYAPVPPKQAVDDVFQLRLRRPDAPAPAQTGTSDAGSGLDRAAAALDRFERRQVDLLATVVHSAEAEANRLQAAIRDVGLEPALVTAAATRSTGGPLVPARGSDLFGALVGQAQASLGRLGTLRLSVASLPFAEPIAGDIDFSSGFGYRLDPFTRSPALHTGLDFRAEFGAPVRAAGAGRVTVAEYSGAYGNMVEIDHGNGVASRYAHLSAIAVSAGQEVEAGTRLGHVGSTGRSTGPHLHYETRIGGEAVNPQRFLKAGASLAPLAALR